MEAIKSPCIKQCQLDNNQICQGCWRHIDEIINWSQLSDAEKQSILEKISKRTQQTPL